MPVLLKALKNETSPDVKSKTLYLTSSLIRNSESTTEQFLKEDGLTYVKEYIKNGTLADSKKAIFLIDSLIRDGNSNIAGEWKRIGGVKAVIQSLAAAPDVDFVEKVV